MIGVLASIAIPLLLLLLLLLRQRKAALEATVRADVRHVALAVEAGAADGRYPDHLDVAGQSVVLASGTEVLAAPPPPAPPLVGWLSG